MQLKLSSYHFKTDYYKYNMFYVIFPRPQKIPVEDTQKKKERNQSISLQKRNQFNKNKKDSKRRKEK